MNGSFLNVVLSRSVPILGCFALTMLIACSQQEEREWVEADGYRYAPLHTKTGEGNGFTEIPARQTGIIFFNTLRQSTWLHNRHYVNGSGVALGDVNGDGWPDVFFAGMEEPNQLYLNRGNWKFEEVSKESGVDASGFFSSGAVLADIDSDGDLDLLTTSIGSGILVFQNDSDGVFEDVTDTRGVVQSGGATSMALSDVDSDGDLDLYVGFYKSETVKDLFHPDQLAFERVVLEENGEFHIADGFEDHYRVVRQRDRVMRFEYAEQDRFYLNDGTGRFKEVPFDQGAFKAEGGEDINEVPQDWALSVRFQDYNNDGIPDLYVCNDFESPDHFWIGDGEGGFQSAPSLAIRKSSQSTMSIAAGDVDADGFTDIFLADMLSPEYVRRQRQYQVIPPEEVRPGEAETRTQVMQNMLLVGRGDGTFAEVAHHAGVAASEWTWGSAFLDVDLDGFEDLLLTTGHAYDAMDGDAQMNSGAPGADWREHLLGFPELNLKNIGFRNRGRGTFEPVAAGWGLGIEPDVSHGFALADLDLDGDLDVVVNRLNARAGMFRNNAEAPRIAVLLRGIGNNRHGVGSRIFVSGDGLPPRQKEVLAGGYYLSSSEPLYSFAAREGATIEVRWRSGLYSRISPVQAGYVYEIDEQHAAPDSTSIEDSYEATLMVEAPLSLRHDEELYSDFARQPLLPRRLSQRGPGVALSDLNGDGREDLLVGASRGHRTTYALNLGGGFGKQQLLGPQATGDQTGLVVSPSGTIITGLSNYERTPQNAGDDARLAFLSPSAKTSVFGPESPGPLLLADFDGDNQLDLFVGGHFVPGRYPETVSSRIYRGDDGQYVFSEELSFSLKNIGLVSGAVGGDIDTDGDQDLVLAMDWGPVRILLNDGNGLMSDQTEALGTNTSAGWWNGVALGDFDSDGLLDIIATNWGTNSLYAVEKGRPLVAHYGDIDRNGSFDIIESLYEADLRGNGLVRDYRILTFAIPPLLTRAASYGEFSEQNINMLFDSALDDMNQHEVTTMRSMVFMNRGDRFEAVSLPEEVQWSPAFAPVVADFDGDGAEDVFLSQNFFATPNSLPRMDAGRGMMLKGNARGGFAVVRHSGVDVYGDQRGAATGDLNHDGRADLVVTQNAGPVKLFYNAAGKQGLRVVPQNPGQAIGATVRLQYLDGTLGAARIITAGSGYWSQNAMTQVLGMAKSPASLRVHWPGGTETDHPLAIDQKEVIIDQE